MRRSHVERRSRKYAATQYVSESHDHKPDVPTPARQVAVTVRRVTPKEIIERAKDTTVRDGA